MDLFPLSSSVTVIVHLTVKWEACQGSCLPWQLSTLEMPAQTQDAVELWALH